MDLKYSNLMDICPKFEGKNLSDQFWAEIEFGKIGPWSPLATSTDESMKLDMVASLLLKTVERLFFS
jgi:hypothetical protein